MNPFVNILFGHLVGDFFLQNKYTAVRKGESNLITAIHCLIYTLSIAVFTHFDLIWLAFVFVSHFVVDRWSLADKWLRLINGRSLTDFFKNGHKYIPPSTNSEMFNYRILRGGFTSICYVAVDFGLHLIPMWYFYIWWFN